MVFAIAALPGGYCFFNSPVKIIRCYYRYQNTVKILSKMSGLSPFSLPILPIVTIQQPLLKILFSLKPFAVAGYTTFCISLHHQLLKNKWYYVLYSTVKFISLCCKGERTVKNR